MLPTETTVTTRLGSDVVLPCHVNNLRKALVSLQLYHRHHEGGRVSLQLYHRHREGGRESLQLYHRHCETGREGVNQILE